MTKCSHACPGALRLTWLLAPVLLFSNWVQGQTTPPPRPIKIRSITAFIKLNRTQFHQQIEDTVGMLKSAKAEFEKGGYEVQTLRVTTQPFPQYTRGMSLPEMMKFFHELDELAKQQSVMINIGPAMLADSDSPVEAGFLNQIISTTGLFASLPVAADDGIHWNAVRAAARVIKYVEAHSAGGKNNFDFAATAMMPPYAPFYPGSYHTGDGHQFSVAFEGGNFVTDVFAAAGGDLRIAEAHLAEQLNQQARAVEAIALSVE